MPKRGKKSLTERNKRAQDAKRKRIERVNESEEQKVERLRDMASCSQALREKDTPEEVEERRRRVAVTHEIRRQSETEEQATERRRRVAVTHEIRRQSETEEQATERRRAMASRDKNRRENETEEEATERRRSMSVRAQLKREKEAVQDIEVRENRLRQNLQRRKGQMRHNMGRSGISTVVQEHNCGELDQVCGKCSAIFFKAELSSRGMYSHCCHNGKVVVDPLLPYPEYMRSLMDGSDVLANNFKDNIRSYNSALSFASMGAQIAPPPGSGPFCFKIHGQIYHRTSNLHPPQVGQEKYAQLYVLDTEMALRQRMNISANVSCKPEIMQKLDGEIRRVNPFAEAFRMLREIEDEAIAENGPNASENVRMYITDTKLSPDQHKGVYNAPKINEVAIVFRSSDGIPPSNRDICIYPKGSELCNISAINPNCDPMSYVLFFPRGEKGWCINRGCTELQFYNSRLSVRINVFNPILYGGKLLQQYIVDSYVKVEAGRLNYIRRNQKELRVETYLGLADHLNTLAANTGVKPGVSVILPSTFVGSPRAMHQNFQDAMAIVREFGKPDLFLTLTCNPKWSEIKTNLFPGQRPNDRPDLVVRVFDIKKKALLDDVKKNGVLGRTVADIHAIEFQKRGLPHMHLLLILSEEDKIRDSETIDTIVCAELPDPSVDSELSNIVKATMIHGPCGALNPDSPCMVEGICSKGYPKPFRNETVDNIDGYPMYRRRDNGNNILIRGNTVDNRWVVPYNSYLSKKYNAHINVEICSSIKSIKYLFKYVYKGYDCAKVQFKQDAEELLVWDEIESFLDARYVSAPEGMWRLLEKKMHEKSHTIIRLPVHLPNMQNVYFNEREKREAFDNATGKKTMLTAWFELNKQDQCARNYVYTDIPKHFVWRNNGWHRRFRLGDSTVTRMYSVSPKDVERYHLRLLLTHVPGATSFESLKSYEGVEYETFKESCRARHFLEDDDEWQHCLREACSFEMPAKLRQLFVIICVFCNPSSPLALFEEFKQDLSEDFIRNVTAEESFNKALIEIRENLLVHHMTLDVLGLPQPTNTTHTKQPDACDVENDKEEGNRLFTLLNPEQREIFQTIISAVKDPNNASPKAFCVNAFAGAGKSFLFNSIIHTVRGMKQIAVPVAWTGIAAILLQGGRTVHSRFKLPVPVLENSTCKVRHETEEGRLLKAAKIIIWDECTMAPHHALTAVDRLLTDLVGLETPFGGKVFVLGGDWRQILPVAIHANRTTIVESCLKNSSSWRYFRQFTLTQNMRTGPEENAFAEWLLKLGDGCLSNNSGLDRDMIEIPSECIVAHSLVDEVFGSPAIEMDQLADRAILCPKNEDSLKLNEEVLKKISGETKTYFSADSIVCDDEEEQNAFPMEFVNSLTPSGMPPHELNLKVGVIVMLLRNLNPAAGLCNGTRLIVKRLMPNVIDAEVLTGQTKGSRIFIPRILLTPSDTHLPFQLRRRQFPLRLAFAMTINKAQGQSLRKVGIYLPQPVFTHGMLYVAFSRATSINSVRVMVKPGNNQGKLLKESDQIFTKNVVFRDVFHM